MLGFLGSSLLSFLLALSGRCLSLFLRFSQPFGSSLSPQHRLALSLSPFGSFCFLGFAPHQRSRFCFLSARLCLERRLTVRVRVPVVQICVRVCLRLLRFTIRSHRHLRVLRLALLEDGTAAASDGVKYGPPKDQATRALFTRAHGGLSRLVCQQGHLSKKIATRVQSHHGAPDLRLRVALL